MNITPGESQTEAGETGVTEYVTATVAGQLFGLPISRVHDVFIPDRLTRVPLASGDVAGVLNLRGRIVTAIDMRARLGFERSHETNLVAIGVDLRGESYGLLVDNIGEVLKLSDESHEPNPINIDTGLAKMAAGVFRLEDQLMVVLDVERVLDILSSKIAA